MSKAKAKVKYDWPNGGRLNVSIKVEVTNPEALAAMRIETERLWTKALGELVKVDADVEAPAPDA